MLQTELSASATPLQHRHLGAIAGLVLISLLSSLSGSPVDHALANSWEGFLWGIADPVLSLDRLVSLVAIGLLSIGIARGTFIAGSFVFAALLGTVIHLFQLNFSGAEIAIATSAIAFGALLLTSSQLNWVVLALLGAIAGLFHGYANGAAIIGVEIMPLATYILGITLTQYVIVISAREINSILPSKLRLVGLAFCAVGIVFLHNSIM
ncbi:MAG: HupE/UreJ family protein [Goleter apudmare HA4340-LM2]|jgi:urease accessory protein|nr:HupE/UreJ family protein [Goleter apudmare HA4340-LM2]